MAAGFKAKIWPSDATRRSVYAFENDTNLSSVNAVLDKVTPLRWCYFG